MLWKKINRFWRPGFLVMNLMLLLSVSGCSDEKSSLQNNQDKTEQIMEVCSDIYEKAAEGKPGTNLEVIRSIVNIFGEKGYAAVDSRNQVDMVCAEQVIAFCGKVDAKEEDKLKMIEVTYLGGLVLYDLQTKDGNVEVVKSCYEYKNNQLQKSVTGSYPAEYWNYTEDGYLMFSGVWFSEDQYVLTLSGVEEHTAFRVQPLDETCRELNRKYLLPVSYERNNMFLTDWSEEGFGTLNFYDFYDIFYPKTEGELIPYVMDENLGVGAVYRIPKDEFEHVIMTYFNIDSGTLQSKTTYYAEDAAYEYKPRGFYEAEYPEYPYPEVVGFTENRDGTITLMVHVVFPYAGISKVYAHEVVVRPFEDGGVQYVSNRMIPSEDNQEKTWHTPRLTEEEWEETYGGDKKASEEVGEPSTEIQSSETVVAESTYGFLPALMDLSENSEKR